MRRKFSVVVAMIIALLVAGIAYAPTWPCNEENWTYHDGQWGEVVYWERIDCACNYDAGPPWGSPPGTFISYSNWNCNTNSGYSRCYLFDGSAWTEVSCEY